jgi:hypothetical protein
MENNEEEKDLRIYVPYIIILGALLVAAFVAGGFLTPSPHTIVTLAS